VNIANMMDNKPSYEELEQRVKRVEKDAAAEYKKAEERIKYLNAVLSSIRNIHRLVSKVANPEQFIRKVCDVLVKDRGYHNAWIILTDVSGTIFAGADAGLGKIFLLIIEKLKHNELIYCCKKTLAQSGLLIIDDPLSVCVGCPVSHIYGDRGAMAARLEHDGKIYGMLTVSVPTVFSADQEEHALFEDIACDIAFALHNIKTEEERRKAEDALRKAHNELEQRVRERTNELEMVSSRLLNAQEEERKRIAGDIHDGIGQSLSAVKFMVETTLQQPECPDISSLNRLIPMLQKASEEVRAIVMNLRPSVLDDLGILATVGWFCRQFRAVYPGISVEEQINIREREISDTLKTIMFRVLQEAMNNIAKHSNADIVRVYLGKTDISTNMVIEDNGRGFDKARLLSEKSVEKGFGITGMKERTELSGGSFSVDSALGEGTVVRASWLSGDYWVKMDKNGKPNFNSE